MKILFVLHVGPTHGSGGTELYAEELARSLCSGHDVRIFFPAPDRSGDFCMRSADGVDRLSFQSGSGEEGYSRFYVRRAAEQAFRCALNTFVPDVVHFHHLSGLSASLPSLARKRGCTVFFTLHDFWLICPRGQMLSRDLNHCGGPDASLCTGCEVFALGCNRPSRLFARMLRSVLLPPLARMGCTRPIAVVNRAVSRFVALCNPGARERILKREASVRSGIGSVHLFLVPSRALYEVFLHWGIPAAQLVLHPKGYETTTCALPLDKNRKGRLRFGYMGSLMPSKGIHVLLRAYSRMRTDRTSLALWGAFCEDDVWPGYERYVRKEAERNGVKIKGPYPHEEKGRVLNEIDILVVPSIWTENAPRVISESLLAGIEVIASDEAGISEMMESRRGMRLFRSGSAESLRRVMAEAVERAADPARPGDAGAAERSLEEDAAVLENLYICVSEKRDLAVK